MMVVQYCLQVISGQILRIVTKLDMEVRALCRIGLPSPEYSGSKQIHVIRVATLSYFSLPVGESMLPILEIHQARLLCRRHYMKAARALLYMINIKKT